MGKGNNSQGKEKKKPKKGAKRPGEGAPAAEEVSVGRPNRCGGGVASQLVGLIPRSRGCEPHPPRPADPTGSTMPQTATAR